MILPVDFAGLVDIFNPPVGIMDLMAAVGDVSVRAQSVLEEPAVHLRLHIIVAVHKGDPVAGGLRHAPQTGGGNAAVFLENCADFIAFFGVFPHDRRRIVRGTIVHHDNLQLWIGLGQQAVQAPA